MAEEWEGRGGEVKIRWNRLAGWTAQVGLVSSAVELL